jgi:hypothetical protein
LANVAVSPGKSACLSGAIALSSSAPGKVEPPSKVEPL